MKISKALVFLSCILITVIIVLGYVAIIQDNAKIGDIAMFTLIPVAFCLFGAMILGDNDV
jgi:uncharacterized membrane protein